MTEKEHQAPEIHLDAAPGVDFYHLAGFPGMRHKPRSIEVQELLPAFGDFTSSKNPPGGCHSPTLTIAGAA
jgi:hypothetical protein